MRPLTALQAHTQALQPCRIVFYIQCTARQARCGCCSATSGQLAGSSSSSSSASSTPHGRYRRISRSTVSTAPTDCQTCADPRPHVQQQSSFPATALKQEQQQHQARNSTTYSMPPLGALLLQQHEQPQHQLQLGAAVVSQPHLATHPTGAALRTAAEQLQQPGAVQIGQQQQQQQQQQASRGVQPPASTAQRATTHTLPLALPAAADLPPSMRYTDFAVQAFATSDAAAAFGGDLADALHAAAAGAATAAARAEARVRRHSFAVSPGMPSSVVAAACTAVAVALVEAPARTRRRRASTTSNTNSSSDSIESSSTSSSTRPSSSKKKATAAGSNCIGTSSGGSRSRRRQATGSETAASSSTAAAGAVTSPFAAAAVVEYGIAPAGGSTTGRTVHVPSPGYAAAPSVFLHQQQQCQTLWMPPSEQQLQLPSSLPVQQQQQQPHPLLVPVQQQQPSLLLVQQQQQPPMLPMQQQQPAQQPPSPLQRAPPPQHGEQQDEQQVLLALQELLEDEGIQLPELRFGQHRTLCPACQGGSSHEDCFALSLDEPGASAVWLCHRATCGCKGRVALRSKQRRPRSSSSSSSDGGNSHTPVAAVAAEPQAAAVPPDTSRLRPLSRPLLGWLHSRGISTAVLTRNRVSMESRFCRSLSAWVDHIAFPFYSSGRVVNIKYRALPKLFQQSAGGQQVFYGLDDIQGFRPVLIVEGELDKLAVEEATGAKDILSVPAGASAPASSAAAHQHTPSSTPLSGQSPTWGDKKYAYVRQALPLLRHVTAIVIGVDGDAAGWHTAQQLANRLGRQRCWHLPWPAAGAAGIDALQRVAVVAAARGLAVDVAAGLYCKDANDVLMCYGKRVLALYVKTAPVHFPGC